MTTWPVSLLVHEGHSAYSDLARLPDDRVGLLYEWGPDREHGYRAIVMRLIALSTLKQARPARRPIP